MRPQSEHVVRCFESQSLLEIAQMPPVAQHMEDSGSAPFTNRPHTLPHPLPSKSGLGTSIPSHWDIVHLVSSAQDVLSASVPCKCSCEYPAIVSHLVKISVCLSPTIWVYNHGKFHLNIRKITLPLEVSNTSYKNLFPKGITCQQWVFWQSSLQNFTCCRG